MKSVKIVGKSIPQMLFLINIYQIGTVLFRGVILYYKRRRKINPHF